MITPFLLPDEVPPNLLGLHPGDTVRVRTARAFVRAGYRLRATDLHEEVDTALKGSGGWPLCAAYTALLDSLSEWKGACGVPTLTHATRRRLVHALARDLVAARHFGGPERGIHIVPWADDAIAPIGAARKLSALLAPAGAELVVDSTYIVQVGTYYGPSYGSPPYYDDAEPGGLLHRKPVVIVIPRGHYPHVLSGDLERA